MLWHLGNHEGKKRHFQKPARSVFFLHRRTGGNIIKIKSEKKDAAEGKTRFRIKKIRMQEESDQIMLPRNLLNHSSYHNLYYNLECLLDAKQQWAYKPSNYATIVFFAH